MLCRVSTTGLLLLLTAAYPHLQLYFMLLVTLDLASHWYQMYATLAAGGITHKVQAIVSALLLHKAAQGCSLTKQFHSASCCISLCPGAAAALLLRWRACLHVHRAVPGSCCCRLAGGHLTLVICCISFWEVPASQSTTTAPSQQDQSCMQLTHSQPVCCHCRRDMHFLLAQAALFNLSLAVLPVQDIDSHSMLVRYYYQHRIFMGFCCVSVEVLYLLVSALSKWKAFIRL